MPIRDKELIYFPKSQPNMGLEILRRKTSNHTSNASRVTVGHVRSRMHDPSPIAPFHRGCYSPPPNIEVISHRRQSTPTRVTPPWTLCGRMFSTHSLPHHTSTLLPSQGNTRFLWLSLIYPSS
ncbi:hypothetical protein CEXT_87511 [Caerostris extrusa]|uniref:Uncharacterized protein n=1 Tax=Caerostris extrusa TaxID=172846 RepID=A0AAV4Y4N1_CAEEX|nr:hypothetical protein CEXT_87511 [Caerostris extrusa]